MLRLLTTAHGTSLREGPIELRIRADGGKCRFHDLLVHVRQLPRDLRRDAEASEPGTEGLDQVPLSMAAFAKSWRVSLDFEVVQNGRDIPNWGCAPK